MNSMGVDVRMFRSGTNPQIVAYLYSIARSCTDSHTGGNKVCTTRGQQQGRSPSPEKEVQMVRAIKVRVGAA